jgi:hypothetical protein
MAIPRIEARDFYPELPKVGRTSGVLTLGLALGLRHFPDIHAR